MNAKAICDAMGHVSVSMTFDRYAHLMPDGRDQARERLDAYIGRLKLRAAGDADRGHGAR